MAEVEMTPVDAAVPPKINPLTNVESPASTISAKPGLKLPPKPGATVNALRPGLKLPPKPAGSTLSVPKAGLKLPPKPVIRKPGATISAMPLPKPVAPVAPKPVEAPAPVEAPKAEAPKAAEMPKPMEQLKSVTQKLKGITQAIPQQAILRKTGIIADGPEIETAKEAAKHKTARISLSDAMGVAPVKEENSPMKTIKIKRPVSISAVKPTAEEPAAEAVATGGEEAAESSEATTQASTITQRKTLKIARPGGVVRPAGKFGIKRPASQVTTVASSPAEGGIEGGEMPADGGTIADIPEISSIPEMPAASTSAAAGKSGAANGPAWLFALSTIVQAAACVAIGALAWFLYQNTQVAYF